MKIRLLTLFALLSLMLTPVVSAANTTYVMDDADLFSTTEEKELEKMAEDMTDEIGADVVIFTSYDNYSGKRDYYVEDIYYGQGYDDEGILLHIDMYNRQVFIQVFGDFQDELSYDDQDALCDVVWKYLPDGNYYKAATTFVEKIPATLNGTVSYGLSLFEVLVVVVPAIIAFYTIVMFVTITYGSEGKDHPYPFRERATYLLSNQEDRFVRDYTTSVRIQSNSGGGGGGGRSSGRSSRSSGRRF